MKYYCKILVILIVGFRLNVAQELISPFTKSKVKHLIEDIKSLKETFDFEKVRINSWNYAQTKSND